MLKPSANMITVPHKSTYSLVIAVAKRARQIAQKAEDEGIILTDKPVDMAVQLSLIHISEPTRLQRIA